MFIPFFKDFYGLKIYQSLQAANGLTIQEFLSLIIQTPDRHHIHAVFTTISKVACTCKRHHERRLVHLFVLLAGCI